MAIDSFKADVARMSGLKAVVYVDRLVRNPVPSEGFIRLIEAGPADLTCEATI
jgi:hypothetical protein